jgi:hypothetical protein
LKTLLYIRGEPGSGKHTIGQLVARQLEWDYLWFHDLYRLPKPDPFAIACTVIPALASRLASGINLVFTRPSRLASTVKAAQILASHFEYNMIVARLTAPRSVLLQRVKSRESHNWRVSSEAGLDDYLRDGGAEPFLGEVWFKTDARQPEQTAIDIVSLVRSRRIGHDV